MYRRNDFLSTVRRRQLHLSTGHSRERGRLERLARTLALLFVLGWLLAAAAAGAGPPVSSEDSCDSQDRRGTTPLMRAAFAGAEERFLRLLDDGADPNARCSGDGPTPTLMLLAPLFAARFASAGQVASAPLPLPPGIGTDTDLQARRGMLYALLSSGADPDARQGETHPLTVATMLEQVWAVEALTAFGADPDRAPDLFRTARIVGNPEISRLLGIE